MCRLILIFSERKVVEMAMIQFPKHSPVRTRHNWNFYDQELKVLSSRAL